MQDKSSIKIDFNNMLAENIGAHGIMKEEYNSAAQRIPQIHSAIESKRGETRWRDLPYNQDEIVADIIKTAKNINENYENFVVLGIGGSALGLRALMAGLKHIKYNELGREKRGGVRLYVEDNIDPDRMSALFDIIDIKKTVFNIITKSGNTVETMSQGILAMGLLKEALGADVKDQVIITTDAAKGDLKKIADENGFKTYIVPDGVGGRFSVLCPVGILGAAVLNIDIKALLKGAADMDKLCSKPEINGNPAYMYATLYYTAMQKGVNMSVMLPYADALANTAEWYAQLWAESLGKRYNNKGEIVNCGQTPVRALGVTDQHSQIQLYTEGPFDKVIAFIEVEKFNKTLAVPHLDINLYTAGYMQGRTFNELIAAECRATEYAVTSAGKMNMKITLNKIDAYNLGALLYFFEMATTAAGEFLGINTFDQPGVEAGKIATYALMGREGYTEKAAELNAAVKKSEAFVYSL